MSKSQAKQLTDSNAKSIDFYLTNDATIDSSYLFICRLVDKIYQQKKPIFLNVNSEKEAQVLDDLLWTFRDDGFIPHGLYPQADVDIQIGVNAHPKNLSGVLINLTETIPDFYQQFERILEIVPQSEKNQARKKFRLYREKNCEINTHDLTKTS